jgi:S1-C subfamily serine protease
MRGISLTVPATNIRQGVESLLAHGRIKRGYLGVSTQPVRLPAASSEQLGQETGLLLVAVEASSPAEKGGLLLGDTIVELDNSPIRQHDDLLAQLGADRVDSQVVIKIIRGGQLQEVEVVVGERN